MQHSFLCDFLFFFLYFYYFIFSAFFNSDTCLVANTPCPFRHTFYRVFECTLHCQIVELLTATQEITKLTLLTCNIETPPPLLPLLPLLPLVFPVHDRHGKQCACQIRENRKNDSWNREIERDSAPPRFSRQKQRHICSSNRPRDNGTMIHNSSPGFVSVCVICCSCPCFYPRALG